jgi:hypothetical protein
VQILSYRYTRLFRVVAEVLGSGHGNEYDERKDSDEIQISCDQEYEVL